MRVMTAASLKLENFEPRFSKAVSTTKLNSLKRRINFGAPLDAEKEMKWVNEKLKEQEEIASKLWNFNFREGKTLDPDGSILWVAVNGNPTNSSKCEDDKFKFQPIDPVKTTTLSVASSGKSLKQKSITDFMPSAKNRQINSKDISERPSKIRKMGDCSS